MGRKSSIDTATGSRLLEAYKRLGSERAAAAEVGVSVGAAQRYFAALDEAAAPVISSPLRTQVITAAGASLWDTRGALEENYARVGRLVATLELSLSSRDQVSAPAILAYLAALKENREHIGMSVKLAELLVNLDAIQRFQAAVIEVIGDVDATTRERIISRLAERGALVGPALGPG